VIVMETKLDDRGNGATQHIDILDYGRFLSAISAISVLMFHYLVVGPAGGRIISFDAGADAVTLAFSVGYIGVDFFFIVSGFVIALSAASATPKQFIRSRFFRLYPTFLLCMTATALVRIWSGRPDLDISLFQYFANWTMVSQFLGFRYIDGVYWTLAYEIIFYILMLFLIIIRQTHHLETICRFWLVAIIALDLVKINIPGFTGYFALFCAGCMFSCVWKSGWSPARIVFLTAAASFCALQASTRAAEALFDDSVAAAFLTVCFFVVFALFSGTQLSNARLPFARTIGLMTYPLYLLHAYIGYVLLSIVGSEETKWVAIAVVALVMLLVSFGIVRWIDRPMQKVYDKIWPRRRGGCA
jgi:peptidoglycan/LPS O-acetylase OafA/YrhL